MKLNEMLAGTTPLSEEELIAVHAGESLWYWVAYGVGLVARGVAAYLAGVRYASETMPGLR